MNTISSYVPRDSFATVVVTRQDLYTAPNKNYCWSTTDLDEGLSAVSFCRYDPEWVEETASEPETLMLMRGCAMLCQEICRHFGLAKCIYYECLMNANASVEEMKFGGIRILCPVCHKKLKCNLKFDSGERFERLAKACNEAGFFKEEQIYRNILRIAGESKIEPRESKRKTNVNRTSYHSSTNVTGRSRAAASCDTRLTVVNRLYVKPATANVKKPEAKKANVWY